MSLKWSVVRPICRVFSDSSGKQRHSAIHWRWFFFKYIDPVFFSPRNTTWLSLQYSGDEKLIEDFELRNSLVEHYNQYSDVHREYERHFNFAKDYLASYFMELEYGNRKQLADKLFSDNYFRNLSFSLCGIYQNELEVQRKARQNAERLLGTL